MFKKLILLSLLSTLFSFPVMPVRVDGSTTNRIQRLGTGYPTSIAASPDGKTLATRSTIGVCLLMVLS